MSCWNRLIVLDPFVHRPKMGVTQADPKFVDEASDQRELLRWADRTAEATRVIGGRLAPRADIFERLREVEFLKGLVKHDLKSGARKLEHILLVQLRDIVQKVVIQRGVIPPVGRNRAKLAWHREAL